jgi:peptidoglycan-associated lipoprotein
VFERGYFTSNRKGGKGGDDIYQFELPPLIFTLQGVVTDSKTGAILTDANVQLIASNGNSGDKKTDNAGSYNHKIKPITSYELVASLEGYLKKKKTMTTIGVEKNTDFVIDFELDPIVKEIILPRIEYDFNSAVLRPESKEALDALVAVLLDNPTVIIELRSHTDFRAGPKFNLELSQSRAQVCVDYMVLKGVESARLIPLGMGESEPSF